MLLLAGFYIPIGRLSRKRLAWHTDDKTGKIVQFHWGNNAWDWDAMQVNDWDPKTYELITPEENRIMIKKRKLPEELRLVIEERIAKVGGEVSRACPRTGIRHLAD